jgi:hypothetical protein
MIQYFVQWLSRFVDAIWPIAALVGMAAFAFCIFEGNRKDAEAGRRYWRATVVIWMVAYSLIWLKYRQFL